MRGTLNTMTPPYSVSDCSRLKYEDIDAINQSTIKCAESSMAHLRHKQLSPPTPPSPEMTLGNLTEHFSFGTQFEFERMRFPDFRTKEAQTWRDGLAARGIPIVDEKMEVKAKAMTRRVMALPELARWKPWRTNIALVGVHEPTGLLLKGLCDVVPNDDLVILDLKTTRDASIGERGFGAQIVAYGLDIQAWWYQTLWEQVHGQRRQFACVCVENEPPYETSIQVFHQDNLDRAGRQVDRWLAQYRDCLASGEWPGYPSGLQFAKIPKYRFADIYD